MRDEWTDERMDDFRDEVYRRFDKLEERFEGFENRFAALQRTLLVSNGTIVAGLIGVIATQV
ncbi:MAG TPA: hypothetical protein VFT19_04835 [Solirubrobacterales bacterium]|nr:hypothetical protein [Solirubrobacterales bacterium]